MFDTKKHCNDVSSGAKVESNVMNVTESSPQNREGADTKQ